MKKITKRESKEKISVATLYNTVQAFKEKGYLKEISIKGNKTFFDTNTKHHHHFYDEDMSRLIAAVARVQDVDAFEKLFRHFGPRVKAYMMRHTGNLQTAEELMQETMMLVWNKAALFDPDKGNASTWIFTIARNSFISAYRKQNRPEFDPNDPAFVPDDIEPADVEFQNRQEAERVRTALKELPEEQRELVQRSFFGDVSHSDLAEEFGLPLGTVKSRIRMAIAKLRKSLGER